MTRELMTEPLHHQPISERVRAFLDGEFRSSQAYVDADQELGALGAKSVRMGVQIAGLRILLITEADRVRNLASSIEHREINPLIQLPYSTYTEEVSAVAAHWDREWDPHGLAFLEERKENDLASIDEILITGALYDVRINPARDFFYRQEMADLEKQGIARGEDIVINHYKSLIGVNQ